MAAPGPGPGPAPSTPPPAPLSPGSLADPPMFTDLVRPGDTVAGATPCRLKTPRGRVDVSLLLLSHTAEGHREHALLLVEPDTLAILRAIPVVPSLEVSLEQVPPSPSASFFAQSSKPKIEITIRGRDSSAELQFPSNATEVVRVYAIVKELRRAVGAAVNSPLAHRWLAYYPVSPAPSTLSSDSESSLGKTNSSTETTVDSDDADAVDSEQYPNPHADGFNRQAFLRKRLFGKQAEWSTRTPVSVRIVTYNVNDRKPPPGTRELASVLGYGAEDILVVGLQEADLRSQALLMSQGDERAEAWEAAIFQGLREKEDAYEKVAMEQYVGVILFVFAKTHVRPHIRMVQGATKAIGLWGIGGNKAGVAFRMKVHDTTVCFVNSHLAAFASQLARRRLDYQALRSGLTFPLLPGQHPPTEAYYPDDGQLTVDDADVLFWFGDLNYRVDLQDREVTALVESKDWEKLIHADQLTSDITDGLSFEDFSEARIDFKPSYKYVHGSTTYDPKRAPAYCDRVLYKSRHGEVMPNKYTCHDLLWSDHLPVSCTFTLEARVVDEDARADALVATQRELDKLDELYRPSLAVAVEDVDFGDVSYLRQVRREVTLRNDGLVPATYSFRAPAPGKPICMPYFWPYPAEATVEPKQELTLVLTACVDETMSAALTTGTDMNDVLVLQVEGGSKEAFITLRASFLPTIVGLPLDVLPELLAVIRDVPLSVRRTLLDLPEEEEERADKMSAEVKRAEAKAENEATDVSEADPYKPQELETGPEINTPVDDAGPNGNGMPGTDAEQNGSGVTPAPSNGDAREAGDKVAEGAGANATVESAAATGTHASDGSEQKSDDAGLETGTVAAVPDAVKAESAPIPTDDPSADAGEPQTPQPDVPPQPGVIQPQTPLKDAAANGGDAPVAAANPMAPVENIPAAAASSPAPTPKKDKKKKKGRTTALTKPPREVWRLLERLMDVGAGVDGLWVRGARADEVLDVIDALDTGAPTIPGSAYAAAAALLHVLGALPGHLVPESQKWNCRLIMSRDDAYAVVERIPGVNANVLIGLASVARLCCGGAEPDKETIAALTMAVFGSPALTRVGLVIGLVQG